MSNSQYSKQSISFWKTDFGSYKTHKQGLTQDQVDFLKTLKPGDELLLFINNDKKTDTSPDASLKQLKRLPTKDANGV